MISKWKRALLFGALVLVCLVGIPRTRHALAEAIASAIGTAGQVVPGLTLQTGGTDGTNLRTVKVDTNGDQLVVGTAAEGAAQSGSPVTVAGRGFNGVNLSPRYCDKVANITTLGTTATIQQIAGVASQSIWVCGMVLNASTAAAGTTIALVEGTGSNCATGTATIGALLGTTPTAVPTTPQISTMGGAVKLTATAGDSLCIQQGQATNSTALSGSIFYTVN
jgi:hypothetical protein